MVKCPNCSEKTTYRLMTFEESRTFDEEKQLPVTSLECNFCNTKMKFIGPVCIDCAGSGKIKIETGARSYKIDPCSVCDGKSCQPEFIEIEWGEKPQRRIRSHYEQERFNEGLATHNQRMADKHNLRTNTTCRGGYFCKSGDCYCDVDTNSEDY